MLDININYDLSKIMIKEFLINGVPAKVKNFGKIVNHGGEIVFEPKDINDIPEDILYDLSLNREDLYEVFTGIEESIPSIDLEVVDMDEEWE